MAPEGRRTAVLDGLHHATLLRAESMRTAIGLAMFSKDLRELAHLEKDRHSELTMCVFNGTGRVVEFHNLQGQVKFNAPNNTDPDR